MSIHEHRQGKELGRHETEWEEIVDKIEEAIVLTLANKVLENAGIKEEKIAENRKKVRLVEFRGFPRKRQVN